MTLDEFGIGAQDVARDFAQTSKFLIVASCVSGSVENVSQSIPSV